MRIGHFMKIRFHHQRRFNHTHENVCGSRKGFCTACAKQFL
ncbi:Uncharacterised protein [Vibrio cholerae]|nr:Uncharacterised protein [Vibrio cholerae]CSI30004.1 Uncharacterised protein [Vibrio cholerae]